nr:uncharacterized protein CTRU02_12282 [Colletotrichum truncatum]KAF6784821.1 hypothetical protein CTRU02_12282 [Colletotrichum truncatum]
MSTDLLPLGLWENSCWRAQSLDPDTSMTQRKRRKRLSKIQSGCFKAELATTAAEAVCTRQAIWSDMMKTVACSTSGERMLKSRSEASALSWPKSSITSDNTSLETLLWPQRSLFLKAKMPVQRWRLS